MTKQLDPDFEAPYPAFEIALPQGHGVVFALIGVEAADVGDRDGLAGQVLPAITAATGVHSVESARSTDERTGVHHTWFPTYWRAGSDLRTWLGGAFGDLADAALAGSAGLSVEWFDARRSHLETSGSVAEVRWGVGRTRPTIDQPVHAYYGAARDRIDAAEDGALPATIDELEAHEVDSRGRDLEMQLPGNLCFIRTVQGFSEASDEEQAILDAEVLPAYREGVAHLASDPTTGCLSARLVDVVGLGDETPQLAHETYAWFRSLGDLEGWTHHHPKHEAIFGAFGQMAARLNFQIGTVLGHEVTVVEPGRAGARYVNCHPSSGLLPWLAPSSSA